MAEYINKKYLDRKFQIDMMCLRSGTIFDTQRIIDSLPTADVIERSRIDKAIEQIATLIEGGSHCDEYIDGYENGLNDALEILKRNIGE